METKQVTGGVLLQKIRAYGVTTMSGTNNECEEVIAEIAQMIADLEHNLLECQEARDLYRKVAMTKGMKMEGKLPVARANVFESIGTERFYQERKWGTLQDHPQSVGAYLTLMRVHLADAEAAWARSSGDSAALDRLRRVLAIGVACGEQHGMPKRVFSEQNGGAALEPKMNLESYREAGSSLAGDDGGSRAWLDDEHE